MVEDPESDNSSDSSVTIPVPACLSGPHFEATRGPGTDNLAAALRGKTRVKTLRGVEKEELDALDERRREELEVFTIIQRRDDIFDTFKALVASTRDQALDKIIKTNREVIKSLKVITKENKELIKTNDALVKVNEELTKQCEEVLAILKTAKCENVKQNANMSPSIAVQPMRQEAAASSHTEPVSRKRPRLVKDECGTEEEKRERSD